MRHAARTRKHQTGAPRCLTWMVQERNIMSWPRVPRLGMYSRIILCRTTTGLGPSGG